MRKFLSCLAVLIVILSYQTTAKAQVNGAIAGTVVDQNGALVPNATVVAKGQSGQEFTVTTSENGTYRIPAVSAGLYTVTVTANGFKKFVAANVKVDVGLPATVDTVLEVGEVTQVVEVTSGAEVLQTQTATVATNIQGRQIVETPIASRDALDLVQLLPGTNSVGAPRRSSINGLPKGALSITIDGVDVQDNLLRSSDGYFTYVRPRVDAIEEVTVSTANPGAESSGDGAVQIKFVTKRGTNNYRGGIFYQHRDEGLNAAYFFNNRDLAPIDGKAPRNKIRLNQYGGNFGGPLPFPRFGEGGRMFDSGKDKAFFFFNYEEFRQPESQSRTRVILTPEAQAGNYSYINSSGAVVTRNVFTDVVATNPALGQPTTPDPTVAALFARIRSAVATQGTITTISSTALNTRNYNFTPQGGQVRKFFANRYDFNLTKNHSFEFVMNRQTFVPSKDFLNSQDERFPGFPSYTQGSTRNSYTPALRSTFGKNIVNEFRFATSQGRSEFSPGISPADFAYSGSYLLDVSTTLGGTSSTTGTGSISSPYSRNSYSARQSPTYDWTDSVTWIKGNHNISFGGQYKRIKLIDTAIGRIVPTITFGIDSASESALSGLFNSTTLPGSSATQQAEARMLYATLAGHILGYTSTAYLTADGTYKLNAEQTRLDHQDTYGLFAQDSWRVRPGLTVNYGLRWQPQGSYVIDSGNYARISDFTQIYGVSGFGNIFRPGTLTGTTPTVVGMQVGESAYNADKNNFAPTVGVVWSPDFGDKGLLRAVFGASGKSVFRGGYSVSFVREGTALIGSILGGNPGGNLSASRSLSIGNLTTGTNLRAGASNPNLTPAAFSATPSYPITLTTANSTNAFDPNIKTGSVHSFSFGYQRQLDKNTVIEARYVGTRGYDLFRQHNLNELNTIENGFAKEFAVAQQNLYANIANGNCQVANTTTGARFQDTNPTGANYLANCRYNFAYSGPNTGTSPLPISLAYIIGTAGGNSAVLNPGALNSAGSVSVSAAAQLINNYTNAIFRTSSGYVANLNRVAPSVTGFASTLENNAARRANAIAAGLPSNFFYVNPATPSGSYLIDNSGHSWYDSAVIELRRRLSNGLRVQASYTFGKARTDSFQSNSDNFANYTHRDNGAELARTVAVFDIRHAFKLDATYDLPFGKGRMFLNSSNRFVDALVGGFTIAPVVRWQSGSPIQIGNVQLVGMTVKELQKAVKVRKEANFVYWLPDDIIQNSQRAFSTDPFSASGYGATFGGAPQGRFIAPAGYGNCQQRYTGDCGFNNLVIYGPSFLKLDVSVSKKFSLGEKRNIELRATFLDALNRPNFRVGGWNADVVTSGCCGSTFGQLGNGTAYQDISTTNDPGGRLVDLMFRFNF